MRRRQIWAASLRKGKWLYKTSFTKLLQIYLSIQRLICAHFLGKMVEMASFRM
jgi:hypothetical protein